MTSFLILASIVIFACVILNKISSKLGIPMLLAFILLGMIFGTDGILKIPFDNYDMAEQICTFALIFIIFYGGFGTNWRAAKPVVAQSLLLSSLGVVITAALTGLFCHFVLHIGLLESFLIGSVISSTDAASVFSILRSKRLNLKYNTASMLELESGSNDPFSYMLTVIFIAALSASDAMGVFDIIKMLILQIVLAGVFGVCIAVAATFMLRRIRFATNGFDVIFVVAIAIISYALPTLFGGNGYLSAYIVGIVLGNVEFRNKKNLVHFFDGITGLMQILIFFMLGLLAFPSKLPQIALVALLIALFLTFIARPIAVFAILAPFRSKLSQSLVVSWAGLRGAASIVFAIMATMAVETDNDIFHIVFFIVLFSILLQGTLLPLVSKLFKMIDKNNDVMKTFNDYTDEVPVQFIQFALNEGHQWCGSALKDVTMPPSTLVVLLKRGDENIVPSGQTLLRAGDKLILSAGTPENVDGIHLSELKVRGDDEIVGKTLAELPKRADNSLIIMIQRKGAIIIPSGDVVIEQGDVLVINHSD